jgi:signal transduction histidine kinase
VVTCPQRRPILCDLRSRSTFLEADLPRSRVVRTNGVPLGNSGRCAVAAVTVARNYGGVAVRRESGVTRRSAEAAFPRDASSRVDLVDALSYTDVLVDTVRMTALAERRLVWASLLVVGVAVLLVWSQDTSEPDTPALAAGNVLVGIGFTVTALLLAGQPDQRGNAALFAGVAGVWTAQQIGAQPVGWFVPVGYFLGAYTQVLAAAALLRYPGEALEPLARRFISITVVFTTGFVVAEMVSATPEMLGLPSAPWPSYLAGSRRLQGVTDAKLVWLLISAVVFLWFLRRRWVALGGMERRTLRPIVLTATVVGLATAARSLDPVLHTGGRDVLGVVLDYAAAMLAIAFLVSALQLRLARSSIADLATVVSGPTSVEMVRDGLRVALADPELDVFYWVPERAAYVDAAGSVANVAEVGSRRMVVKASATDGSALAVIVADGSLRRHQSLVESAVAVSRLALENARLQAGLRFQLAAAQEARARLLHTGLEQRRHLERDLHDGAQQRLLALGLRLGAIESSTENPQTAVAVKSALEELHLALSELRDLAHGLYPAVLSQGGLGAALEAIVERLAIPVQMRVSSRRWHPDVESAVYMTACEALTNVVKHAAASRVKLEVKESDGMVVLDVTDDGSGCVDLNSSESLADLRSRVGALGGELRVRSSPEKGTSVSAVIPCE